MRKKMTSPRTGKKTETNGRHVHGHVNCTCWGCNQARLFYGARHEGRHA